MWGRLAQGVTALGNGRLLPGYVSRLGRPTGVLAPGGRLGLGYADRVAARRFRRDDAFGRCFAASHRSVTTAEVEADLGAAGFIGITTRHHDEVRRTTMTRRPPPAGAGAGTSS